MVCVLMRRVATSRSQCIPHKKLELRAFTPDDAEDYKFYISTQQSPQS